MNNTPAADAQAHGDDSVRMHHVWARRHRRPRRGTARMFTKEEAMHFQRNWGTPRPASRTRQGSSHVRDLRKAPWLIPAQNGLVLI